MAIIVNTAAEKELIDSRKGVGSMDRKELARRFRAVFQGRDIPPKEQIEAVASDIEKLDLVIPLFKKYGHLRYLSDLKYYTPLIIAVLENILAEEENCHHIA